ncbi:MAG: flagellar biosynthesis protein FlhA [Gemmatimonadetes bacterium]|nr:flagellar biosynthesis protein FlhA [Gemmatimonadota bacterium]|tara:strand:- start:3928 stop:5988 length:2061 start_codon:yes stop_codon:yes gene_type:complete
MNSFFERIAQYTDVLFALSVIGMISVMIIPMPPGLLDLLLAFNIAFSLLVLLMTIYITNPLQLSVFPGLLLVLTLFRLSLNVATTRLILGDAYAGEVINAFGQFVVKGNYILGFVVFLIIVIIQFVVITKGAGRVAEVAARFTLDAMPGKQMSIDADLNAGLITEEQARTRRDNIAREADFYGAMDGASKFVRGDAIAGILITLVNILGGLGIGVLQIGMEAADAAQTYTILTIGDGLVSQIPALITSISAGIIVTRSTSEDNLGTDLLRELTSKPRAIMVATMVLLGFALVPGLPSTPFLILAFVTGAVAFTAQRSQDRIVEEEAVEEEEQPEERVEDYLHVDPLEIQIGYGLIPLVDPAQGGDLLDRVTMLRKQTALDLGIVVPPIRIRDDMVSLGPNQYAIKIRGISVATGDIETKSLLAMDPGYVEGEIDGQGTVEPAFGLPAKWIADTAREQAEILGYTVVEPPAVLATHLTEIIKSHASEILTRQDTQTHVDRIREKSPTLIDELIPDNLSVGGVQKVMQNLLKERIPVRDTQTILECLADYAPVTKEPDILTEYVRGQLGRTICQLYQNDENSIPVLTVAPELEQQIADAMQSAAGGIRVVLPPETLNEISDRLSEGVDTMVSNGQTPVVLTSPNIRLAFRRVTETTFPSLTVLSYNEIVPGVDVFSVGMIALSVGEAV